MAQDGQSINALEHALHSRVLNQQHPASKTHTGQSQHPWSDVNELQKECLTSIGLRFRKNDPTLPRTVDKGIDGKPKGYIDCLQCYVLIWYSDILSASMAFTDALFVFYHKYTGVSAASQMIEKASTSLLRIKGSTVVISILPLLLLCIGQAMSFDIASDLKPRLSSDAGVLVPGDEEFSGLVARWREFQAPTVAALVQVATEGDIQETIRYANERNIPYFGRSGGHGANEALSEAENAIQIDLRKMSQVIVAEDGKTAKIGGGANVVQVVNALESVGKRTVTGICECVGVSAVALGGGHGWLQGQYGLPADQVISARLVVPSGEVVTVSDDSNPDLFWAIRGAGHNFGYVAEWTYRIYDANPQAPKWGYSISMFTGDKLEALFAIRNEMQATQPPEAVHLIISVKPPGLDLEHPIIWYCVVYDGPEAVLRSYVKPFEDVEAISRQVGVATTHELAGLTFQDTESPGCAYGLTSIRFPVGLQTFDIPALRRVYDHINTTFQEIPEIAGSYFLLEGFSTQAVKAVDERSTAFPHRSDNILITSYVQYAPDPRVDPLAIQYGRELQKILLEASGDPEHPRTYVNYAHGDEDPREVYGWEDWRLEKLRCLKREWDPQNRMRYYMPFL